MIWSVNFLEWYTQTDKINSYLKDLKETVFSCMELSRQSYNEVMSMPIQKVYDYMRWKIKLEEDKQAIMKENMTTAQQKNKSKKKR